MSENTLAELILTKFCHDIAGATGALLNGAELLKDSFDDRDFLLQATNALIDSSKFLTYRLRFFRATFGTPKQNYTPTEAKNMTADYASTLNHISLLWEEEGEEDFALTRTKMIACFIAFGTLVRGGEVTVTQRKITTNGQNALLSELMKLALSGNESQENNSEIAAGIFLHNYMQQEGYKLSIEEMQNRIFFTIE